MISEPPNYDPVALWQKHSEFTPPSLQDMRRRADNFDAEIRRGRMIFATALVLHLAMSLLPNLTGLRTSFWWFGVIQFALLITWVTFIPFRNGMNNQFSLRFLISAADTPVFDFYRRQLIRRRDYFQDDARRTVQIIVLGFNFILYSVVYPKLFIVFGLPLLFFALLLYKRRKFELPKIQQELQLLDRWRKETNE
jgi:tellurite resistance protein TehA-like permease